MHSNESKFSLNSSRKVDDLPLLLNNFSSRNPNSRPCRVMFYCKLLQCLTVVNATRKYLPKGNYLTIIQLFTNQVAVFSRAYVIDKLKAYLIG